MSGWAWLVVVLIFVFVGGWVGSGALKRIGEQDYSDWEDEGE